MTRDTDSPVLFAQEAGVRTLKLNRSERRNAMDAAMDARLRTLVAEANGDAACRVIVVTGAGSAFCSGADRSASTAPAQEGDDWDLVPDSIARSRFAYLLESRKPVIAAINGPAVGVGLVLACCCAVRIVADNARLQFPYVQLGLVAEYGIAKLLADLIGQSRATELLLSGRPFDGAEAGRIGLAQHCVAADALAGFTRDYASNLAAKASPRSLRVIQEQLRRSSGQSLQQALAAAGTALREARASSDYHEAKAAAAARRPALFTGS